MHFPGRITSVVAALMTAALLFSCSGPESEKDPVKEEPSVTPQPPSPGGQEEAKAPRADLLDVVFSSDGSARDVSAKGMSVRYVPGPALATYSNDAYGRVVAAFTRKMGVSVSDGFYRIDYKDDKAFRDALADGHSLEVVFKANHTSDGSAEVKVFSSHQSGGTGFLISTSARGTQFNFLPNVSSDGKSKWIWTPCGFTPKAGVYYHAVGVWNKKEGKAYLYMDGALKGQSEAVGNLNFPTPESCLWFGIGGDPGGDNADSAWDGEVVLARIYDDPLTSAQVKLLYNEVKLDSQPEHITVNDVSFLTVTRVMPGCRFRIYGDGFKDGDVIRFESSDGKRFDCPTSLGEGFVAPQIPSGITDGEYKVFVTRGGGIASLGVVRFIVGDGISDTGSTKVVAHRGFHSSSVSENSIAALQAAQDLGIYGSEFDVWITTDGVVVVNHNPSIPGDSHVIQNSTYSEIKDVKLSNGEYVPTLEQYLRKGKEDKDMRLVLEIKSHDSAAKNAACVQACVDMVKALGMEGQVDWIAFSLDNCKMVKELLPDAKVQYLSGNLQPSVLHADGIDGIDYSASVLDSHPEWIGQARDLGMTVNVWTVNDVASMLKFAGLGVDFITTNNPDVLKGLLSRTYVTE